MIKRTLEQIQNMIKIENKIDLYKDIMIQGVSIDSREIEKGNLFIPFQGEHSDGHSYVEAAIKQGASAALWQKDVPNPPKDVPILLVDDTLTALQELSRSYRNELDVKVVGITGSNGKTTVKDMTAALLSLKYKVKKTEGNFNNHIGMPLTILSLDEETEVAVLEMGMSGKGEIEFLSALARPQVAVITNIGESHLQDLGSREGIAQAKLEIMKGLDEKGLLIYMGDEILLKDQLSLYRGSIELKTFGRHHKNDLHPTFIEADQKGCTFKINKANTEYYLPVLGNHNVLNALSAMLCADYFHIPYEMMDEGFANLKLTQMRMEMVEGKRGERIINDAYNASPTSMKVAIELVSDLTAFERKILVLGDMFELGEQEKEFHYEVGRSIDPKEIDYVFTIGNLALNIAEGAKAKFSSDRVFSFQDKQSLINKLQTYTDEKTLILVKASRGMKLEDIVVSLKK